MEICLNLSVFQSIKSADLLTYSTLLIAYLAFVWSVRSDFDSWKSLLRSFSAELNIHLRWIPGPYPKDSFKDNISYSPSVRRRPMTFEALKAIIAKGAGHLKNFPKQLGEKLVDYNTGLTVYNKVLDDEQILVTSNPKNSQLLEEYLLRQIDISFAEFTKYVENLNGTDKELYGLAKKLYWTRKILHEGVIGDDKTVDGLYSLHSLIFKELTEYLSLFESSKPWFIKPFWFWSNILTSAIIFLLIEWFLR